MLGSLVRHRRHHHHVPAVRGVDRLLGLDGIVDHAERFLDDPGTRVEREEHSGREALPVGDERIADPHGNELTLRTGSDITGAVRRGHRVVGLTAAVSVVGGVERVVVAGEKIPTGDVVDIAVVIVVDAVGIGGVQDEVFGVGDAVVVLVGDRPEVGDVEHAVVIAVTVGDDRVAGRLGLTDVDVRLGRQIGHVRGIAPADPRIEDGDRHGR